MKVPVSALNSYTFCPRSIHLSHVLRLKPAYSPSRSKGLISHTLRRELSIRQPQILSRVFASAESEAVLQEELSKVFAEAPYIYRSIFAGVDYEHCIGELRSELLSELRLLAGNFKNLFDELGAESALGRLTPWKVEYPVRSKELMLSGRIDKVMLDPSYVPVEIKTGSVPVGVWDGDQLQTCAYAMLLEESLGLKEPIRFGFVEYTRVQEKRPVLTSENLRRSVIKIRDSVLEILEGSRIPGKLSQKSIKKCDSCGFKDRCQDI